MWLHMVLFYSQVEGKSAPKLLGAAASQKKKKKIKIHGLFKITIQSLHNNVSNIWFVWIQQSQNLAWKTKSFAEKILFSISCFSVDIS